MTLMALTIDLELSEEAGHMKIDTTMKTLARHNVLGILRAEVNPRALVPKTVT